VDAEDPRDGEPSRWEEMRDSDRVGRPSARDRELRDTLPRSVYERDEKAPREAEGREDARSPCAWRRVGFTFRSADNG